MRYKIEAPVRSFSGQSAGVAFTNGTGFVEDADKPGRAALEYFRRHGYGVAPSDGKTDEERIQELVTGTPTQREPIVKDELFDPSEHPADEVLTYLDSLVNEDTHDTAEFDRVLAAEQSGKARKTILARAGAHQQGDQA